MLEKNQESQRAPLRRMEAARLNIFDPKQNVLDENDDHGDQSLKMEDQHAASHRLSMAQLQTMEFKQAFEEFDKVTKLAGVVLTKKKTYFAIREAITREKCSFFGHCSKGL